MRVQGTIPTGGHSQQRKGVSKKLESTQICTHSKAREKYIYFYLFANLTIEASRKLDSPVNQLSQFHLNEI